MARGGVRMALALPWCSPPAWECVAAVAVLDAGARRRVPVRPQLTPHLSEYVPATVVMTRC